MCEHSSFDIVYYKHGVMVRKCMDCGHLEVRLDYIWDDAKRVVEALAEALEVVCIRR